MDGTCESICNRRWQHESTFPLSPSLTAFPPLTSSSTGLPKFSFFLLTLDEFELVFAATVYDGAGAVLARIISVVVLFIAPGSPAQGVTGGAEAGALSSRLSPHCNVG
jgi:hypothetical protein